MEQVVLGAMAVVAMELRGSTPLVNFPLPVLTLPQIQHQSSRGFPLTFLRVAVAQADLMVQVLVVD